MRQRPSRRPVSSPQNWSDWPTYKLPGPLRWPSHRPTLRRKPPTRKTRGKTRSWPCSQVDGWATAVTRRRNRPRLRTRDRSQPPTKTSCPPTPTRSPLVPASSRPLLQHQTMPLHVPLRLDDVDRILNGPHHHHRHRQRTLPPPVPPRSQPSTRHPTVRSFFFILSSPVFLILSSRSPVEARTIQQRCTSVACS